MPAHVGSDLAFEPVAVAPFRQTADELVALLASLFALVRRQPATLGIRLLLSVQKLLVGWGCIRGARRHADN
ncbi:hypothetical protein D8770_27805 [Methylobacterium sp. DB1607]|nr:hypothetical protein [Methylobacterium sp. DB1607]